MIRKFLLRKWSASANVLPEDLQPGMARPLPPAHGFTEAGTSYYMLRCFRHAVCFAHRPVRAGTSPTGRSLYVLPPQLRLWIQRSKIENPRLTLTLHADSCAAADQPSRLVVQGGGHTTSVPLPSAPKQHVVDVPLAPFSWQESSAGDEAALELKLRVEGAARRFTHYEHLHLEPAHGGALARHQGMSFPRSGCSMLVSFLTNYFGHRLHRCRFYRDCQHKPCLNPRNVYTKSHDWRLQCPIDPDRRYIVQIRNPLYAITSNYFLYLGNHGIAPGQDARGRWQEFAGEQIDIWRAWVRKWVLDNDIPNAHVVRYEDVMASPIERLTEVVRRLDPANQPDVARMRHVLAQRPVEHRRRVDEFHHFEAGFYNWLESRAREEIVAAGLPLVMSSHIDNGSNSQTRRAA